MKGNKGFSLVEIIIVIAIMAILTGVIAPNLIKYVEKSKVSTDVQLCDTVRTACILMLSDPKYADPDNLDTQTRALVNALSTPGSGNFNMYAVSGTNFMAYDFINEIVGVDVFSTTASQYFKSTPANAGGTLGYKVSDTGVLYIFVNNSDCSGNRVGHTVNISSPLSAYSELVCAPVVSN